MKKRWIPIIFVLLILVVALSACDTGTGVVTSQPATDAPAVTSSAPGTATEAPPVAVGTLDDYVKTAKEAAQSFGNGSTTVFRLPEILLDSADASSANSEIMSRFGDDCKEYDDYSPVISLDYEAYLNDTVLSVMIVGKFDGGNSYGLCYSFDVTTGSRLNNETLCSLTGRDYNNALDTFRTNLTSYYDEKYATMPGNDEMREKTLSDDNINSGAMYLGSTGKLVVMADIYAAVGGGHWVDTISAE